MADMVHACELVLADVVEGDERRRVKLVEGESLSLVEESSGPLTQFAYGSDMFGHKMLFDRVDCAKAFNVSAASVLEVLASEFSDASQPPMLSDVMDRFDQAQAPYAYASWSGNGDAVFRAASA